NFRSRAYADADASARRSTAASHAGARSRLTRVQGARASLSTSGVKMRMAMEVPRNQGRKSGKHQKAPPEGWPAPGRLLPLALSAIILLGIGPARQALAWGRMGHRAS